MQPITFIDLETTGLSALDAAPIGIAAVILGGEHCGAIFRDNIKPFPHAAIDPRALQVNGYQFSDLWTFNPSMNVFEDFLTWLKLTHPAPMIVQPCGWNYAFDERFLRQWFVRHDATDKYGFLFKEPIETMRLVKETWPEKVGKEFPKTGGMKLSFQYEYHFGKPLSMAHTELADAYATRDLFLHCDRQRPSPEWSHCHHYLSPEPKQETPITCLNHNT